MEAEFERLDMQTSLEFTSLAGLSDPPNCSESLWSRDSGLRRKMTGQAVSARNF
jgi:hypothetical protein